MALETLTIEHDGFTVIISTYYDYDAEPIDGYDGEFIMFEYRAFKAGIELASACIGGTDERSIQEWIDEDYYHPDYLREVTEDARAAIARLTA